MDALLDGAWRPVLALVLAPGAAPDRVVPEFLSASLGRFDLSTAPGALVVAAGSEPTRVGAALLSR